MKNLFPAYHIGHFLNQPNQPVGFAITRFGTMAEPEVDDPHKHTFYELIWTEAGHSRQRIDYQDYAVAPGSLFFISPGQLHEFEEWQQVAGGSIMFTEEFFLLNQQNQDLLFELSFLDNFYANPLVQPDAASARSIQLLISLLSDEYARPDAAPRVLQALLHALLGLIQRAVDVAEGRCGHPDPARSTDPAACRPAAGGSRFRPATSCSTKNSSACSTSTAPRPLRPATTPPGLPLRRTTSTTSSSALPASRPARWCAPAPCSKPSAC